MTGGIRAALLVASMFLPAVAAGQQRAATHPEREYPSAPLRQTLWQDVQSVRPGMDLYIRRTADPMMMYVLVIDLEQPGIRLGTAVGQDTVSGIETVRSMATRKGAVAAINGDYWTHGGVPLNLTVVDGEIYIAPKHRTAFAITRAGEPMIGTWTDGWSWQTEITAPNGDSEWIRLLNSDCNEGWLTLYSHRWGRKSWGDTFPDVTELVLDMDLEVLEVRRNEPGVDIPAQGFVVTGRGEAADWLAGRFTAGDRAHIEVKSTRPLRNLWQAIGAGPRILANGEFVQDPLTPFPEGEEFAPDWKRSHYLYRHPRSGLGLSQDRRTLVLAVVDGRMSDWSLGIYQREMAGLLAEFGAWDGMDLDSGGSSTLFVDGEVINRPSDGAAPDGTGGRERRVASALLVFFDGE